MGIWQNPDEVEFVSREVASLRRPQDRRYGREWHDLRTALDAYCAGLTAAETRLVMAGVRLAFEHVLRIQGHH